MKKAKRMGKTFLLGVYLLIFLAPLAYGQDYPSKPIEVIVGYPPGGVTDSTSRVLCKAAEKYLGQTFVTINKPGVSGASALTYFAKQKPDSYTIARVSGGLFAMIPLFAEVNYKLEDFSFIMGFGYQLHGLSVKADAPWNTFREFLDYAKKNPGKVNYASYSPVSTTRISMEFIAEQEGIDWIHTPYNGDMQCVTALLGGHVDAIATASGQFPYARSGKLKLLAIFNSYEAKGFPNVPTLKSLGYKFPMMSDLSTSQGFVGLKGMELEHLKKLEGAFIKAAKDDTSFIKLMDNLDCPLIIKSGKEYETEIVKAKQICDKLIPPIAAKWKKK